MSRYSEAATHPTNPPSHYAEGRSEAKSVTLCVTALAGQPCSFPPSCELYMHRLLDGP